MSKNIRVASGCRGRSRAAKLRLAVTALCFPVLLSWTALVNAQSTAGDQAAATEASGLEEVTVTAERRQERLVDVPISVTSVSGDTLQAAGVSSMLDLQQTVPGLRLDMSGSNYSPTIRGIGSALAGPGANANVAIYVDGFYDPNIMASDFELQSISSVDVLKGPQGTLFGRNATGGAILVNTREPTQTPTAEADLSYGSYGREKASAYIGGGITPTLTADLTGFYEKGDGYVKDSLTGGDAADFDKYSFRTKWIFTPADWLKITFTYEHRYTNDPLPNATSNYDGLGYANTVPGTPNASGPFNYTGTAPAVNTFTGDAGTVRADIDLGFANLTSYSMYRGEKSHQGKDYDGSPLDIFAANWLVDDSFITQELDLASKPGGRFSWVFGLFYYENVDVFPSFNETAFGSPYFSAFASRVDSTSYAAFGDATYEVVDNLLFTAGLRASGDHVSATYYDHTDPAGNVPDTAHTWGAVTPRAVLRYKLTPDSNVYASFTEGYKSGIIPILQTPPTPVAPEKVNAFEVGYKIASSIFSFDTAAFYYKYNNLQIQAYQGTISTTENAAKSTIYGLDSQLAAKLGSHFTARIGAAYTHSVYDSFPGAEDYVEGPNGIFLNPSVDASGKELERSPKFTGTLGLGYQTPLARGQLALDADLYASSLFYFDPVNRFSQGAYSVLNLRSTWTTPDSHWAFSLYGTNVSNTKYRIEVLPGPFAIQQAYAEPAAVGVQASYRY
jgi:iron complex outermembrane recepter protein